MEKVNVQLSVSDKIEPLGKISSIVDSFVIVHSLAAERYFQLNIPSPVVVFPRPSAVETAKESETAAPASDKTFQEEDDWDIPDQDDQSDQSGSTQGKDKREEEGEGKGEGKGEDGDGEKDPIKTIEVAPPALEEDSLLCFGDRSILGRIFEVMGPVKAPFYSVRFNSPHDLPENTQVGSMIYFVPSHSRFVFARSLYFRGSDASNEHDEEVDSDDQEYSDDEKEAESRRSSKKYSPLSLPLSLSFSFL